MVSKIADHAERMLQLLEDIKTYKEKKQSLLKEPVKKKEYEQLLKSYNEQILNTLNKLEQENNSIYHLVELESFIRTAPEAIVKEVKIKEETLLPVSKEPIKYLRLSKKQLTRLMEELSITRDEVKEFVKKQTKKKGQELRKEYSIYVPSGIGKIANTFMNNLTVYLTKNYPKYLENLSKDYKKADIKMLFMTYVSLMLFMTALSFPISIILFSLMFKNFITGFLFGFVGMILTFVLMYAYPSNLVKSRKRKIKNDLPFAMVHMAAVAGSGARPIDIFDLMLTSGEYQELGKEINKIMNYVNLFGYDLTTALKNVADTTPSPEFKELLNGMTSTIETGGDLKGYLEGKAIDELNTYKLERKKYVEALSTFSDIYTAILIAAPLLFVVVLAIINAIGGNIGGFTVATLATAGTYVVIPLLNIVFIVFLTISQPEI